MGKIIHIVLWKLMPCATDAEADAAKESIKQLLKVPGPISMHVGPPEIEARTQGWNWGLYSVFENRAELDKYAVSDAHMDCVRDHVRPHMAEVMAYDWEISDKTGY
ncbi:hypothetical protein CcaverHIS002_0105740 [Cutaneotrichosporon cavernicola]|nr:hypothetical protein CcaverHIS002_0105740 [Cutaneotrichosporon cavernicola]